jgi:hypothetical protein
MKWIAFWIWDFEPRERVGCDKSEGLIPNAKFEIKWCKKLLEFGVDCCLVLILRIIVLRFASIGLIVERSCYSCCDKIWKCVLNVTVLTKLQGLYCLHLDYKGSINENQLKKNLVFFFICCILTLLNIFGSSTKWKMNY